MYFFYEESWTAWLILIQLNEAGGTICFSCSLAAAENTCPVLTARISAASGRADVAGSKSRIFNGARYFIGGACEVATGRVSSLGTLQKSKTTSHSPNCWPLNQGCRSVYLSDCMNTVATVTVFTVAYFESAYNYFKSQILGMLWRKNTNTNKQYPMVKRWNLSGKWQ